MARARRRHTLHWAATTGLALLLAAAGCKRSEQASNAPKLALDAPIPAQFPRETQLTLGDPIVKKQLAWMGELDKLPFTASWPNISGGPTTIEAYRAGALDGGSVGDTPPIHAAFTGLKVKIVMVNVRDRPTYEQRRTQARTDEEHAQRVRGAIPARLARAEPRQDVQKLGLRGHDAKRIEEAQQHDAGDQLPRTADLGQPQQIQRCQGRCADAEQRPATVAIDQRSERQRQEQHAPELQAARETDLPR